jgi:hypothetical protein
MVSDAQISSIKLGVKYKTIGGGERDDFIVINTCR